MRILVSGFLCLLPAFAQPAGFNYEEAKVGRYSLPDPLVGANGKPVRDAAAWKRERRPEILRLFESSVYGRSAPKPQSIEYEVTSREAKALGGLATRKEVTVWLPGRKKMQVLIYVPNERRGAAPVFLGMNFDGNHAITSEPEVSLAASWMKNPPTDKDRGKEASRFQIEMVLRRGYAVATVYYGDVFPDRKDGLADSILPHLYRRAQTAPAPDDWNAIGAWAWGLSRALDYMEKDRDLDPKRVAVWGHSRLGKTALWAGATDERFAMVISNDSGEGGAALARRNFGETVERINTSFPHWFCGNFKKYNQDVASLPVDQHMLLALIAPRPLYVASAQGDLWADPRGEFLSAKAADPVYRLLGTEGLGAAEMPGIHQPVEGRIGYHIRAGKHDVTAYDWEQFLKFADKQWMRKR